MKIEGCAICLGLVSDDRSGYIVGDILLLSRMQLNMLTLQDSVFPLVREVRQVCSVLFNEMKSKGITHQLVFGDSIKSLGVKYVSVDKVRFGQVHIPINFSCFLTCIDRLL